VVVVFVLVVNGGNCHDAVFLDLVQRHVSGPANSPFGVAGQYLGQRTTQLGMHRFSLVVLTRLSCVVAGSHATRHELVLQLPTGHLVAQLLLHEAGQALAFPQDGFGRQAQLLVDSKRRDRS
jgi:hypothetical protein